jgi:aldose 1-epimerase
MSSINIERKPFGTMPDGQPVERLTLTNKSGAGVSFTTLGGAIISIIVPDRDGNLGDVVLGYDNAPAMLTAGGYMNALIGRVANRIGGASFTLDGVKYQLAANDHGNHLHGGKAGFDKRVWDASILPSGDGARLTLVSPDGDENYPGELRVSVTYTWSGANELDIHYEASTDKTTILNLTNHAYFNLEGLSSQTISDHDITIDSSHITAVADKECIPTGELYPVENTPLDLRGYRNMGEALALESTDPQMSNGVGFDHCYILKQEGFRKAASVRSSKSGRVIRVDTDAPGVQFYSGNHIKGGVAGKAGIPYVYRQGFCLETQNWPDAVNHPAFPSPILKPGGRYSTRTRFTFEIY